MIQNKHLLKGKNVLVIGLGLSGQAAAKFLLKRGAIVVGADRNNDLLEHDGKVAELCSLGMETLHDSLELDLKRFDLVVVSPGVPHTHPYYQQAKDLGIEIIGEIELACRDITKKCVGITGTNGKTTVTLLVAHVLNSAGRKAQALGNVGVPLTTAVDESSDTDVEVFVIELSSFQLETLKHPFLDAGVLLNITPDHLDRYATMQEYALAKICLKSSLKSNAKFFVEEKCLQDFKPLFGKGKFLSYGYSGNCHVHTDTHAVFIDQKQMFLLPEQYRKRSHDLENLMAAYALCDALGISPSQFLSGLNTFKKPSHRIEFVRTVSDVHYYDDSKGTNIDAVVRAVDTLGGSIVLIAGGVDKGFPYTAWIESFGGKVRSICAIGQSAVKIKKDLEKSITVDLFGSLEDAVRHASKVASPGDKVLLSPGCSSFDMFKDYAHRGKEFQRIVNAL